MAKIKKIKCLRTDCVYNDLAGGCIFEKPQLEKKEAYVNCLTMKNRENGNT